jgi:hypothetical protein
MTVLAHGDRLLPDQFGADDFELRFDGMDVIVKMRSDDGRSATLAATWVLSFRFDLAQDEDPVEGSYDTLLILDDPPWTIPYRDEDSGRGDFAREKRFFHLNIPDVGLFECWAVAVERR